MGENGNGWREWENVKFTLQERVFYVPPLEVTSVTHWQRIGAEGRSLYPLQRSPQKVATIGGGILHRRATAEGPEGAVLFILVQSQKIPNPFSPNAFKDRSSPLPNCVYGLKIKK